MNLTIRPEYKEDYEEVENVTREAFWNRYVPGCTEHYLIHTMRNANSFIKELDMVAEIEGKIAGNIVYTKAQILEDDGNHFKAICFGPISVLPNYQGKGIGSILIEHTKRHAKKMGYPAILIYGDPGYYSRFGFVPAEKYGIGTPDNMYAAPLQALELYNGALLNHAGRFFEDSVYSIDESAAIAFDTTFPYKEKRSDLPNQERFRQLVGMQSPRAAF